MIEAFTDFNNIYREFTVREGLLPYEICHFEQNVECFITSMLAIDNGLLHNFHTIVRSPSKTLVLVQKR